MTIIFDSEYKQMCAGEMADLHFSHPIYFIMIVLLSLAID